MKPKIIEKSKRELTYREIQREVGGSFQLVIDDGKTQIVCNEEGKLNGLPLNAEATKLWYTMHHIKHGTPINDVLVGDVLVLKGKARMT